jgi:lysophospholipase L1-like esterase
MKRIKYFLFTILFIILFGELLFLIFPSIHSIPPPYNTAELDERLGWKPKGDYHYSGEMYSLNNQPYPIEISTNSFGFRNTGNPVISNIAILFIGDSFTQSVEVSDSKTFYSILERQLNTKVSAIGMAGYGTLQESLILEEYLDEIDPKVVVLQFCSNDFIDNEIELERKAIYYVGEKRPYLNSAKDVEIMHPLSQFHQLVNKTNFIKFCFGKWKRVKAKLNIKKRNSSELKITEEGRLYSPYQSSIAKTEFLLQKIKSRLGNQRELVVFCADDYQPQQDDIAQICKVNSISFIPFPTEKMNMENQQNQVYSIDGYHWNEAGHQIIANELDSILRIKLSDEIGDYGMY